MRWQGVWCLRGSEAVGSEVAGSEVAGSEVPEWQ